MSKQITPNTSSPFTDSFIAKKGLSAFEEKSWKEFRDTGLLLILNQIAHCFGWAIVYEEDDKHKVRVYPARVRFRGFAWESVEACAT